MKIQRQRDFDKDPIGVSKGSEIRKVREESTRIPVTKSCFDLFVDSIFVGTKVVFRTGAFRVGKG